MYFLNDATVLSGMLNTAYLLTAADVLLSATTQQI